MSKKALELETRIIMQGLEEFATFMSYKSDISDMRILSIEPVVPESPAVAPPQKAEVLTLPVKQVEANDNSGQQVHKSLSFHN